jgi:hypothetical protein
LRDEILSVPVTKRVAPRYSVFAVNPKPRASRYVIPLAAAIVILVSIIAFADADYLTAIFGKNSAAKSANTSVDRDSKTKQSPEQKQSPAQAGPDGATSNHSAFPGASIKPNPENGVKRRSPANRKSGASRPRGQRRRYANPNPYRWLDESGSEPAWTRYRRQLQ